MTLPRLMLVILSLTVWLPVGRSAAPEDGQETAAKPQHRTFLFDYAMTVTGLPADKTARIWLPVPPSNNEQEVKLISKELPAKQSIARDPQYGNEILYLEGKGDADGKLTARLTYRVTRHEVKADLRKTVRSDAGGTGSKRFLEPDVLVPVEGKPLTLLKGLDVPKDQLAAARLFYNVVNQHMRYSKEGTGWGRGDAVWACESGFGNCSDFHSLFMSLARAHGIPAKFEIGFPLPEKRGSGEITGYHCWAKFQPAGHDWIPVDISEANKDPRRADYYFGNLSDNRVVFSTGRDLELVPHQAGPPLNFFVYPYVEVDGKPYPANQILRKFSFKDSPDATEK